ncbi:MAG: carboxypeptidase-like regulatory domain-containing protein [Salinivirgaceae bacterium]|nr:carboxypeptidase-like regulatory domain-containing protein [Salinivirgaceae bacterium]
MRLYIKAFIVFLFLFFSSYTYAQVTRIRGNVIDKTTGEVLPFVNVSLEGTSIGTISGFDGEFFIETRNQVNILLASYIGYKKFRIEIKPGTFQEIEIDLEPETIEIEEIVVNPGENPAHPILRKIIDNKEKNDPTRIERFQYEVYNKMELDINNITEDYKDQRVFKHFQFIFDYIDTSAITGKSFLPVFITESLSDYYYQKQPKKEKEIIKASNISGVSDDQISEFTGKMYLDFNIYDNFVPIMGKEMVSPISKFGFAYYKYYLLDSAFRKNSWCYNISFKPKRKQEPTFTGNFWVQDTTYALESFKIRMADDININFVEDFVAEQSYELVDDSVWFPKKQELFIDFAVTNKEYGFFGRKTTSYSNIKLYPEIENKFFSNQLSQETITLEKSKELSAEEWSSLRHETLTKREEDIYSMVDTIKKVPLFNNVIQLINTVITGYWVKGPVEIGPYYTLYSFNPIEGHRFKFGLRTSNAFSTKYMLTGHLAYGTRDEKLKYGLGGLYMFNKNPRRSFGLNYKKDYEQLGITSYAFLSDNFLSSIFAREQNDKLTEVHEISTFYEHEWFQGFSNTIGFTHKQVYASENVPFLNVTSTGDTLEINKLLTTEIKLTTRFAFNEKFMMGEFERVSLGTTYPILTFDITTGIPNFFGSDYEYYKFQIGIEHKFPIGPFGDFRYIIDAGKIFGKAPYPFLQLHEGNQTYAFDDYAFNLMNYYEFVSNQYVSLMIEHHFNGLFLNHIPMFRKFKWREIVETKILYGDLTQRKTESLLFPKNLDNLDQPYVEAGFGVENIFKFFRVDAIWRLTYKNKNDVMNFGILAKMQVRF